METRSNTKHVKEYIDFAAKHGFDAVFSRRLERRLGRLVWSRKDYVSDFVTPYPDFDVKGNSRICEI